jgi:hypothetical protein
MTGTTIPLFDDIIKAIATICADDAVAAGAPARPLADDEDAESGDYAYLAEALRRPATTEERARFRSEYSAARGR